MTLKSMLSWPLSPSVLRRQSQCHTHTHTYTRTRVCCSGWPSSGASCLRLAYAPPQVPANRSWFEQPQAPAVWTRPSCAPVPTLTHGSVVLAVFVRSCSNPDSRTVCQPRQCPRPASPASQGVRFLPCVLSLTFPAFVPHPCLCVSRSRCPEGLATLAAVGAYAC